jgi:hypothetical protein
MEDQDKDTLIKAIYGASSGLIGSAGVGAPGLLGAFSKKILDKIRQREIQPEGFRTNTADDTAQLIVKLLRAGKYPEKTQDLAVNITNGPTGYARRAIVPETGRRLSALQIALNSHPETIAHEVGHATPQTAITRGLGIASEIARSKPALAMPALLALSGALKDPDKEMPIQAKMAPYIGGLQLAAILSEEARANIRGANLLKQIGKKMPLANRLRMFIPTATYLGHAGLLLGAPLGVLKGIKAFETAKSRGDDPKLKYLLKTTPEGVATTPTIEELKAKWGPQLSGLQ